jgi:hypothetical protein
MVGIELERGLAVLLRAEAVEALDRRMTVRAVLPLAGGAPLELGGRRRLGERVAGVEQGLNVDAVVGGAVGHRLPPVVMNVSVSAARRSFPSRGRAKV